VENLRKNEYEEDSVDLRFGSAIHSALELFNEHTTDTAPVLEKFKSEFVDLPEEKVKTTEHGLLLLENFFPYYRANFSEWETLQTEETGHIDMGEIDYVVKIDRVVRWRGNLVKQGFLISLHLTSNLLGILNGARRSMVSAVGSCLWLCLWGIGVGRIRVNLQDSTVNSTILSSTVLMRISRCGRRICYGLGTRLSRLS